MRSMIPIVLLAGICLLMFPATMNAQDGYEPFITEPTLEEYPCIQIPITLTPPAPEGPTGPPPANVPPEHFISGDCCDIAAELYTAQAEFDRLDDRLDELALNSMLGMMFQQQILMRVPFTADDQQAWDDISNVLLNIEDERAELQIQFDEVSQKVMQLNQELMICNMGPFLPNPATPLVPMPDPLP